MVGVGGPVYWLTCESHSVVRCVIMLLHSVAQLSGWKKDKLDLNPLGFCKRSVSLSHCVAVCCM